MAIAANWLDGQPAATEVDLASFASGLADFDSASAVYCPCGEPPTPHALLATPHMATRLARDLLQC